MNRDADLAQALMLEEGEFSRPQNGLALTNAFGQRADN
jgi:hypothetical protein